MVARLLYTTADSGHGVFLDGQRLTVKHRERDLAEQEYWGDEHDDGMRACALEEFALRLAAPAQATHSSDIEQLADHLYEQLTDLVDRSVLSVDWQQAGRVTLEFNGNRYLTFKLYGLKVEVRDAETTVPGHDVELATGGLAPAGAAPSVVFRFANGMVGVTDEHGQQIPDLQGPYSDELRRRIYGRATERTRYYGDWPGSDYAKAGGDDGNYG